MTISTSWSIEIGTKGSLTEFVSRTLGFSTRTSLNRGQMGTGNAVITLDNNDGALTPNAGGTYSSVDWFSQAVFIECTVTDGTNSETVPVFHGGVEAFTVNDNGTNSTVDITVSDIMTIIGRTPTSYTGSDSFLDGPIGAVLRVGNGQTTPFIPALETPKYGATATRFLSRPEACGRATTQGTNTGPDYAITFAGITAGEIINTQIMPSGPHYGWPTFFKFTTGAYDLTFFFGLATSKLNRRNNVAPPDANKTGAIHYTLVDNPTGTQLTRNTVQAGWNVDDVRNSAEIKYWNDPLVVTADNSTSSDKYGVSDVSVLQSAIQTDSAGEMTRTANRWAKQYDQPKYAAQQVIIRQSTLVEKCADAAYESYADLLDVRSGIWNTASVTYTPTGASTAVTDNTVIFGRTIRVTPSDTIITLDLVPAANYQYLELDSAVLGILDENRLG